MRADVRTPLADPYDMARPGRRRALAVLGAMPVLLTTWPARGELLGYPSHAMRLVVPAAEGSAFDALARA
ncbi:tripartite tricarboxylate transporter substrate binding protein, partial [Ralstonia pseudosolanacearum]